MRDICRLVLCVGLSVGLVCAATFAQDAKKPIAIQVVVSPDGTVKVIDASTGKDITGGAGGIIQVKPQDGKKPDKPFEFKLELDNFGGIQRQPLNKKQIEEILKQFRDSKAQGFDKKQIEDLLKKVEELRKDLGKGDDASKEAREKARQALERVLRKLGEKQGGPVPMPPAAKPGAWQVLPGQPGGRILVAQPKLPGGSVEQKLDLILKQLGDLRRDVDAIKNKIDGKKPDQIFWRMVPGSKPGKDGIIELEIIPTPGKEKKPDGKPFHFEFKEIQIVPFPGAGKDKKPIDPEVLKELDRLIEELEKKERQRPRPPVNPKPNDELEARKQLEKLIREIEELQRKQNATPPPAVFPRPKLPFEKKISSENQKLLLEYLKKLDADNKQLDELIKKLEAEQSRPTKPAPQPKVVDPSKKFTPGIRETLPFADQERLKLEDQLRQAHQRIAELEAIVRKLQTRP